MKIPCEASGTRNRHFDREFFIRAVCRLKYTSGRHTIFSKRADRRRGNRPGVVLMVSGSRIEFLTFGDSDPAWYCTTTPYDTLKAAETYEILAGRMFNARRQLIGVIYVNGLQVNQQLIHKVDLPGYLPGVSKGDVNCDEPIHIGVTKYGKYHDKFDGTIKEVGAYNSYSLPKSVLAYPRHKQWYSTGEIARIMKDMGKKELEI